tara:strand:- start:93 stop:290 length:198 start_codon:yes stop_codon:yes gene_type:complete
MTDQTDYEDYRIEENDYANNELPVRQKVLSNSTIGKILSGNTRGIHNWYVQKILNQKFLYEVINN